VINLEALNAAIAHIEKNPEEWRQDSWFYQGDGGCGTAACLAGTVVLQAGWKPTAWSTAGDGSRSSAEAVRDGEHQDVEEIAMEILCGDRSAWKDPDYTPDEQTCQDLFEARNSLDDIKTIRDEIAAGER
jgi:hypothetical protein